MKTHTSESLKAAFKEAEITVIKELQTFLQKEKQKGNTVDTMQLLMQCMNSTAFAVSNILLDVEDAKLVYELLFSSNVKH